MLIHVTPQFLTCAGSGPDVELTDLYVPEFGLHLKGSELATRQPFANRRYQVGCRNAGQKAVVGILIETPAHVDAYTVEARWRVASEHLVTHRTKYVVLDKEFGGVTDNMVFWYAMSPGPNGWRDRWPDVHKDAVPANAQPRMDFLKAPMHLERVEQRFENGHIKERTETFAMPTVERDRLLSSRLAGERLPSLDSAFRIR